MLLNNINRLHDWQQLLIQAQELAAKMPCTGLSPDKLALFPLEHLVGTLAFLKRLNAKNNQE